MSGASPDISQAAQVARERLHREIERVRMGVEEMLDEQGRAPAPASPAVASFGPGPDVRRELDDLRLETRDYVKRKVRKSEKRLQRAVRELDARADRLERRIDQVESDGRAAEVRIHNSTEQMLDSLLQSVRSIADRIAGPAPAAPKSQPQPQTQPQPQRRPPTRVAGPAPGAGPSPRQGPQGPVGRIGPQPLGHGRPGPVR